MAAPLRGVFTISGSGGIPPSVKVFTTTRPDRSCLGDLVNTLRKQHIGDCIQAGSQAGNFGLDMQAWGEFGLVGKPCTS